MQVKDKEPPTKPRHIRRRRDKRGKSAKRAEKKEEEPAEQKINTKQVWREKEVNQGPRLRDHLMHPKNEQDGEVLLYGPKTWSPW